MRALQAKRSGRTRVRVDWLPADLYYRRKEHDDETLKPRLNDLAPQRPRWGWGRLLILVHQEKIEVGERRFRGIYRELA